MQTAFAPFIAIIAAYLLGSISFAIVAAKLFGLADPRSYGSGNPGATNVLRSGNKKAALFTLIGDALKGWVAVFVAQKMGFSDNVIGLVALAVFFGHLFPIFLKFKGGVLLALDPMVGLAVMGTWLFVAYASRYSSLAALLAAALAPVYTIFFNGSNGQTLVISVISLTLIIKHWQNLQRLLAGQESKIGNKKK